MDTSHKSKAEREKNLHSTGKQTLFNIAECEQQQTRCAKGIDEGERMNENENERRRKSDREGKMWFGRAFIFLHMQNSNAHSNIR